MKKKLFTTFLLLMLTTIFIAGQAGAQTYQRTTQGIKSTIQGTGVEISFFTPSTVRILKSPEGWNYTKESLSVVGKPENVKLSVTSKGNVLTIKSNQLTVNLNQETGQTTFASPSGKSLLEEQEKGVRFDNINDAGVKSFSVYQSFTLEKDEAIYGLGQLQNGKMSQRNQTKRLIQDNLEDVITFFQSVKGYGIFWDNYSPTTFKDNEEETSFLSEVGDCIDYYFMYGGNADGVVAQMRYLTGEVPMFPLWTYGFWQSKERYKSQKEIVGVVQKYRELGIPLDGIIQDWRYWGNNYLWNAMDFLNEEFPDPKKMMEDIHGQNAHMIISIWSSFGPHTKPYRELDKENMLFNFATWPESGSFKWPPNMDYPAGARVYDAYNPKARDIYWKYLNNNLLPLGIDGWWMDSTEPDHFHIKPEDYNTQTYLGSFRKVRNAYPLMTVGGVYDHQRAVTSDKRVFILTRSAFAGQQRYGANTWTGDITASWEVFEKQIPAGLNFSLCGIPHWNSDIGGFFLWQHPLMLEDPDYRELYARWVQFGAFCPMMRSHGEGAPREIYQFGKKGEPVYDAIEKYIHLRYSLLPYIYTTSWEVTANQSSFMRALAMDFAEDRNVWDIHNQYMFGKSLLVCPVTQPMYTKMVSDTVRVEDFSTVKSTRVYLPAGSDWYDFWTNKKQTGGQYIQKDTPIDIMPLYVKAGSILPRGPEVQYATEKKWDNLEIQIYPGNNGEFTLYEDENDNYNYEKGMYSTIAMKWNDRARTFTIEDRKGDFKGMLKERNFNVVTIDGLRKTVSYNGKKMVIKL
ncbi:DUF5110 domain-containing protein [Dysgonomonas sp. 521]|nr:DUF5110 domain-containing protein [Dysgonomonas sp. 521]